MTPQSRKATNQPVNNELRLKRALTALKNMRAKLDRVENAKSEPIAVIGVGCRFPGANNPEAFWELLRNGLDAIQEVPGTRWDVNAYYDPAPNATDKMYTRHGGFLEEVDGFDASFFDILPHEAESLDPQQRLILEVSWEALEHAAVNPTQLANSQTGVFVGLGTSDYLHLLQQRAPSKTNLYMLTGNAHCVASGRLSYLLGLQGPSLVVDTACSSSLVAAHLAVTSLRNDECDLALAAGVNLMLTPQPYIAQCQAKMLSPDGRCHTFDARANGYVRGEGCGVVVLKRLTDAQKDGDTILAIIRGSAVNQDGRTNGLTAPNGLAQQAVIRRALQNARVQPAEVSYIEAHGTATPLGDPIEVDALGTLFRERTEPLFIGSVKTNIGHLEPGAGIAGLIKTVLALHHGEIPPSLHFQVANPYISWDEIPVQVVTERMSWPTRVAGVSSFGFSGTNAHMVLAAAPSAAVTAEEVPQIESPYHLLTLSAKSEAALTALAQRYAQMLESSTASLGDICFTAHTGRAHFRQRLAVIATDTSDAHAKLSAFCAGQKEKGVLQGQTRRKDKAKIAFLFTGQGAQYVAMGRELFETEPTFRQALLACHERLQADLPLLELLYPEQDEVEPRINQTVYTQPALFALEYALAQLWLSWGVIPSVVMGHSVGEIVAACIAGILTLNDALTLVVARSRLMQQRCEPGSMVSVMASEAEMEEMIAAHRDDVAIAAVNGPQSIVLSGRTEVLQQIVNNLKAQGLKTRPLTVSHAFHSPLMEPMLAEFGKVAQTIAYAPPRIPIISNVTGQLMSDAQIDWQYWVRHVREAVRFADGIEHLQARGCNVLVEIGPKPTLLSMVQAQYKHTALGSRNNSPQDAPLLRPSLTPKQSDWRQLLTSLGELYLQDVSIDWHGFHRNYKGHKVTVPTYPFQHQSYWIQEEATMISKPALRPSNDQRESLLPTVREQVALIFKLSPTDIEEEVTFVEMGADSLLLSKVAEAIGQRFGVEIGVHQLFDELATLDALVAYLEVYSANKTIVAPSVAVSTEAGAEIAAPQPAEFRRDPQVALPSLAPAPSSLADANALSQILGQQLQAITQVINSQLVLLGNGHTSANVAPTAVASGRNSHAHNTVSQTMAPTAKGMSEHATQGTPPPAAPRSAMQPVKVTARKLRLEQQQHLDALIARYTQRTAASKARAQQIRPKMADGRSRRVFRPETWEMAHMIVAQRAQGARFWDIDGNEYVDLCMGFGALLFGHGAPFLQKALQEQLVHGVEIGPETDLAAEVAELICNLTGMERVKFATSGTGAVRTALRLARAATGRSKFAMFTGAYHGQADDVLGVAASNGDLLHPVPMAPGISARAVAEALVLPNNDASSLAIIREQAQELAAILVEPVQSRNPGLQPKAFLQQLRQLAIELNIPLIFDEVITGFRIHPGGAQAWYGIEADLATYGKVVGGGMPVGVVAGKAIYLDQLDNGLWRHNTPFVALGEPSFAASTFEKLPLAMATTRAMLRHLKEAGPALQETLNQRTTAFIDRLNSFFAQEQVPIEAANFGSLFRFTWKKNISYLYQPLEMDLFYYHLLEKGVYIWEGRTCYLSTAHTDEDIAHIIDAVKASVAELQAGGFLPKPTNGVKKNDRIH